MRWCRVARLAQTLLFQLSSPATSVQFTNSPAPSNSALSLPSQLSSQLFLFFRELNLKFNFYDEVSLSWPRKPLVISHDDTIEEKYKHNVVLKERLGFAHPQFILNFHIFQTYCSRTLIFVVTYFGLFFRNISKSIFVNNEHLFV